MKTKIGTGEPPDDGRRPFQVTNATAATIETPKGLLAQLRRILRRLVVGRPIEKPRDLL